MKSKKEPYKGFRQMLEGLNPAQRKAVDQIEGPVLVLAGPGTGKTHMLTARIGQILLQTDTRPENILCLTFTDAAALTMRKRLLKLIGPTAHRLTINTFHAFAYGILRDYPQYFEFKDWQLISDLERIEILRELLDELPATNLLKKQYADPHALIPQLGSLFESMKKEGWTTDYVLRQTKAYTDSLLQRKEYYYQRNTKNHKKNDLKTEKYEQELSRMQRFREAVRQYDIYTQKLRERSLIEYADMILLVLEAFERHPELLLLQQEQYLYILVDEYQDTNSAQNRLLLQLINYWDVPNVLIVGDDDQSIYEFQGARLKNMLDFYEQYRQNLLVSVLTYNYRSTPEILHTAGRLIEKNTLRLIHQAPELSLDKTLLSARRNLADETPKPRVLAFQTELHEETWLLEQLKSLHESDFPLERCALIYARHRQSERLQILLAKAGIPFSTRKQSNALDHPLIRIWQKLLQWLAAESTCPHTGEHLLYNILQAPFSGLSPKTLATAALARIEQSEGKPLAWRSLIGTPENLAKAGLTQEQIDAFRQIHQRLEDSLRAVQDLPLPLLIEKTLHETGLLDYALHHPDRDAILPALYAFVDYVNRQTGKNPRLDLHAFMEQLNQLDRHGLGIPLTDESGQDGVRLLTAHASKGLEFDKVFILGCSKQMWEKSGSGRFAFKWPDTLRRSSQEEDALEARRRLFYVAMTRARNELYISYAETNAEGKNLEHTSFIDELEDTAEHKKPEVTGTSLQKTQLTFLQKKKVPTLREAETKLHQQLLKNFRLSISALNTYLNCPLAFYYRFLLKLPEFVSERGRYGQAMHYALQRFFEERMQNPNKTLSPGQLTAFFEHKMNQQQPFMRPSRWQHLLEKGRQNLLQYYIRFAASWPDQSQLELNIRSVEIEGIPLQGVIDRVDLIDRNTTLLIDYKTGKQVKKDTNRPGPKNSEGGKYWRQLAFYKLLYDKRFATRLRKITGAQITYLEPDSFGRFTEVPVSLSDEDIRLFLPLLRETYEHILQGDFHEGCGKPSCPYCQAAKDQHSLLPPHTETEDLDDGSSQ